MAVNYSALKTELERLIEMKQGQREGKIYSEYLESLHKIQRNIKMRSIFEHWFRKYITSSLIPSYPPVTSEPDSECKAAILSLQIISRTEEMI